MSKEHQDRLLESQARFDQLQRSAEENEEVRNSQYDERMQLLDQKIDELEKKYNDRFATEKPVSYWNGRLSKAKTQSKIISWVTLALFLLSGIGMYGLYKFFVEDMKGYEFGKVALVVFVSTLVVWLLKVSVRLLFTSINLAIDASERVVLCETYLSLLERDKALEEPERSRMMEVLFRPSNLTGPSPDSTIPPALTTAILKVLDQKK